MKFHRRGLILFVSILFLASLFNPIFGSAVGSIAAAGENDRFWEFVDRVVSTHPDSLMAKAGADYQNAVYDSMGWWDDPSVDIVQTNRTVLSQESTVLAFSVRQRLPLWGAKQRHRPVQQAVAEAAKLQSEGQRRRLESDTVQKVYLYARAKVEQRHLKERRARLGLLKSALLRTKAASPAQNIERQLVSSAIVLTESQFDTVDSEVATRRAELLQMGLEDERAINVKWITPSDFKKFILDRRTSALRANPEIEAKRQLSTASSRQREALKARPEFEVFAQSDDERGGARERNFALGLGLRIPIGALFGANKSVAEADVLRADADLRSVERFQSIRASALELELNLVEKSLERFNPEKVRELEAVVDSGETNARRGWVTVPQLLELERQIHSQIEATFETQIRTITLIKQTCDVYDCDARKHLGVAL